MKGALLQGFDPYEHLAMEECLLMDMGKDPSFVLYRNRPAVVVGSFQNTHGETRAGLLREKSILLARRMSGGGSVYHDEGNLCWAFLLPCEKPEALQLGSFLSPLVKALGNMGIGAEQNARNDLLLHGKKISGCAARIVKDRLLLHGTLLYDANLGLMAEALGPEDGFVHSIGTKSVKSDVANIKTELGLKQSTEVFMETLLEQMGTGQLILEEAQRKRALALAENKYRTWEWIFGKNPACRVAWQAGGRKMELTFARERVTRAAFSDAPGEQETGLFGETYEAARQILEHETGPEGARL